MNTKYKNSDLRFAVLATDVACFRLIDNRLSVLLGRVNSENKFKGLWALIGGLILATETADESVKRHLQEKAGVSNLYIEQLYTFSEIDRDPRGRVVSVAYIAFADKDPQDLKKAGTNTRWYPVDTVPKLAYDHDNILKFAIERLRSKIAYTNIIQYLLPKEFTMTELQKAYETVLGRELDKRNFRKKILQVEILKDTKKTKKEGVMRPATIYSFATNMPKTVDVL